MLAHRILIIGGSGFVGPRLVRLLLQKGAEVTLLNRGTHKIHGTRQIVADRNDVGAMEVAGSTIESTDAVVDLSCYNLVQSRLAWSVLSSKTTMWIHLSSASVYSSAPSVLPRESSPLGGAPIWGDYGRDKSDVDTFLLAQPPSPVVTIFRPPYLYGPGNDNDRETFVWARALRRRPVLVPGDGLTPIQFLHVDDLAKAIFQAIVTDCSQHRVLNIADAEEISLREFAARLSAIAGCPDLSVLPGAAASGFTPRQFFPFRDYPTRVKVDVIYSAIDWKADYNFSIGFKATYACYSPSELAERTIDTNVEDKILRKLGTA